MNTTTLTFESIDSTNSEALRQARLGADEGLCVVARQQTAGRGRHGRKWESEKDAGLYFSIVLRPQFKTEFLPLITLMAGVAVHDTLAEFDIRSDIKWVNDILVKEKKICGILAETADTDRGLAVVVGIGINLESSNFPPEIADTATSMEEHRPMSVPPAAAGGSSQPTSPSELAETLTRYLTCFYTILRSDSGPTEIIDEWRKRSTYFSGKPVRVVLENEAVTGVTNGLEPNGALRLRKGDGGVIIIQTGDVELIREAH